MSLNNLIPINFKIKKKYSSILKFAAVIINIFINFHQLLLVIIDYLHYFG